MTTRRDRDDEAARWIARRQSGEMTAGLEREYAAWLVDEKNRAAMERYEEVLSAYDAMSESELAGEFDRQLNEEFDQSIEAKARRQRIAPVRWTAIAAGIALTFAVGLSLFLAPNTQEPVVYASRIGERLSVALGDGSTATLNTNSEVAVTFSANERGVEIAQGEALFDVAKDASRPFIVETPLGEIRVTGTVFNVRSLPDEMIVQVVSGHVRVTPKGGDPVNLTAGESLRLDPDGHSASASFDVASALAWRDGKARYADTPLGEVIDDLNRYFERPLVLDDESIKNLPVTGEFDVTDQPTAVAAITAAFDLTSTATASRIVISPTGPH